MHSQAVRYIPDMYECKYSCICTNEYVCASVHLRVMRMKMYAHACMHSLAHCLQNLRRLSRHRVAHIYPQQIYAQGTSFPLLCPPTPPLLTPAPSATRRETVRRVYLCLCVQKAMICHEERDGEQVCVSAGRILPNRFRVQLFQREG